MSDEIEPRERDQSWKVQTLALGALIGALTGLGAAYLLMRRAEQKGERLTLTGGQGLKLGMLVAGLLQQILRLNDGK